MIFAVLEDWYHHIVLTQNCKLLSFFYIYPRYRPPRLDLERVPGKETEEILEKKEIEEKSKKAWWGIFFYGVTGPLNWNESRKQAEIHDVENLLSTPATCVAIDRTVAQHCHLYTVSEKNILEIFDCSLKKNYQILVISDKNIFDTTDRLISHRTQCLFLQYICLLYTSDAADE